MSYWRPGVSPFFVYPWHKSDHTPRSTSPAVPGFPNRHTKIPAAKNSQYYFILILVSHKLKQELFSKTNQLTGFPHWYIIKVDNNVTERRLRLWARIPNPWSCAAAPSEGLRRGGGWAHPVWMARSPVQCGPVHPRRLLPPGPTCSPSGSASDATRKSPWGSRARPQVGWSWSGQAESRMEPSGVCYHVSAWIPLQSRAREWTLSGNK